MTTTKPFVDKALILKDAYQQLRVTRSNLESLMTGLSQLSLYNIAMELRVGIARELDEVLDNLKYIQEESK